MKTTVMIAVCVVGLTSCYFGKDIQVERVNVELVKVDTIYRQSGIMKVLTWKTDDRMEYISMEPIGSPQMDVGSTTVMLMKK